MADLTGRRLGPYELQTKLGQGGMGAVYVGVHQTLHTPRAIKVLLPTEVDEAVVERFVREGVISASLRHPNIVEIFDVGEQEDIHFLVMELVEGVSLLQLLRGSGALPIERVVVLMRQVADALDYAHARGVVHRDIKPSNIIVTPDDHVTLIDFGIARALDESRLTRVGVVVGTFEYMAPEVVTEGGGSPGADRYALGIVAYQMITGRVPFTGESAHSIMYRQVHEAPPPPSRYRPDLTEQVEAALLKQLAKSPDDRFPSAQAFVDALAATEPPATQATQIADITRPGFDRPTPGSGQTPLPRSSRATRPGVATVTPPAARALPASHTQTHPQMPVAPISSEAVLRPVTRSATSATAYEVPARQEPGRRPNTMGITLGIAGLVLALLAAALVLAPSLREAVVSPFVTAAPTAVAAKPQVTAVVTSQPAVTPATATPQTATVTPAAITPTTAPITPTLVPTIAPTVAPTLTADQRLVEARQVAAAGNFRAALDILDSLSQSNPTLAGLDDTRYDVHMAFAKALQEQNNPDGSYGELAEALKIRPNDAAALDGQKQIVQSKNYAAMEAAWGNDEDAALKAAEDNFQIDPNYRDVRLKLYALLVGKADRLLEAGERDAAFQVLMHALDANPDGVEAKQRLTSYTPTPTPEPPPPPPAQVNTAPAPRTNTAPAPAPAAAPARAPAPAPAAAPARAPAPAPAAAPASSGGGGCYGGFCP